MSTSNLLSTSAGSDAKGAGTSTMAPPSASSSSTSNVLNTAAGAAAGDDAMHSAEPSTSSTFRTASPPPSPSSHTTAFPYRDTPIPAVAAGGASATPTVSRIPSSSTKAGEAGGSNNKNVIKLRHPSQDGESSRGAEETLTRSPGSVHSHIALEPTDSSKRHHGGSSSRSRSQSADEEGYQAESEDLEGDEEEEGAGRKGRANDHASSSSQGGTLINSNSTPPAWDDSDDEGDAASDLISTRKLRVNFDVDSEDDDPHGFSNRSKGKQKASTSTPQHPTFYNTNRDGTLHGYTDLERERDNSRLGSALRSLLPSRTTLRTWWASLTSNPSQPASLSISAVSLNLFSTSLHPAVLLSLPFYFDRTQVVLGMLGLVSVAALGGVGGGLWVVLGRYVNANNVESIVAAGCGRNSRWKAETGRTLTALLLGTYATGAGFIAYFALADLLLQIFFHYSPRGIPLHDRAFVTLVIGGLFTTPLLVFPLAKRTLVRLNSGLALTLYPLLLAILLWKVYTWDQDTLPKLPVVDPNPTPSLTKVPFHEKLPNGNPFAPPSIWAPYSLLPLLTLSISPLQIMQHQRSLRRKGISGSNVKAFMGAQTFQVLAVIGICTGFGVGVGLNGMHKRLGLELHPNMFTSLPKDDDMINFARLLFVLLLSSHLALCVVTARSSWSRILRQFKINPLRRRKRIVMSSSAGVNGMGPQRREGGGAQAQGSHERNASTDSNAHEGERGTDSHDETADSPIVRTSPTLSKPNSQTAQQQAIPKRTAKGIAKARKAPRRWGKLARNALAGLILWGLVAGLAYASGNGRIRRGDGEKEGEEARFTRASEVLGLMGAAVGFVMPSLVWMVLFWIRRPRSILPVEEAGELERRPLLPHTHSQGIVPEEAAGFGKHGPKPRGTAQDNAENGEEAGGHWHASVQAVPSASDTRDLDSEDEGHRGKVFRTWVRHAHAPQRDEETAILLARKERQMQKRTRGQRRWQDLFVLGGVLPLGLALLVLGAIELQAGGY